MVLEGVGVVALHLIHEDLDIFQHVLRVDLLRFHKPKVLFKALEIFAIHYRLVMIDRYGVAKIAHVQKMLLVSELIFQFKKVVRERIHLVPGLEVIDAVSVDVEVEQHRLVLV